MTRARVLRIFALAAVALALAVLARRMRPVAARPVDLMERLAQAEAGWLHDDTVPLEQVPPPPRMVPRVAYFAVRKQLRRAIEVPISTFLEYSVGLPRHGVLKLALGVPEGAPASRVEFQIKAISGGESQTLLRRELAPGAAWADERVEVGDLAGRRIRLRFEARPIGAGGVGSAAPPPSVWWGHPRLEPGLASGADVPSSVLWISIDTLRADHLGHLGYWRDTTPHLDDIALDGVTFRQAESSSSWTLAAHASMLTAAFPPIHGATQEGKSISTALPTAPELFAAAGYFCGAFTAHIFVSQLYDFQRGFHTFYSEQNARAETTVDRAVAWLAKHGDRPTFLFLHFFDPHWSYDAPEPYRLMYDPEYDGPRTGTYHDSVKPFTANGASPSPRDLAHVIARYDGEIRYTDDQIGRLVEEIEKLGLADRTLLVITADHGEEFRDHGSMEHGHTLFEEQTRVPLIFHGAALGEARAVIEQPVRTVDILPTLLDLLSLQGVEALPPGGGVSLANAIRHGDPSMSAPAAFAETRRLGNSRYSMRLGPSKVIRDRVSGEVLLFDLASDPGETTSLAGEEAIRLRSLVRQSEAFSDALEAQAHSLGSDASEAVALTPEQQDLLRSLGYLQ